MTNIVKFSKEWLVKLASTKAEKRTEYKDTEIRYLRATHHTGGTVKLSVYRCPRGTRKAVRVALPFTVTESMPNLQQIRAEANKVINLLDQGINPNEAKAKANTPDLSLRIALNNYIEGSTNTERVNTNWRRAIETHLANWLDKPLKELCTPQRIFAQHRLIMREIANSNQSQGLKGDGGIGANEVLKKLRRILNFNRALDRSLNLPQWPAEELGGSGLKMWVDQKPRTSRIHREEFGIFWPALETLSCPVQRDLFKFMLLIGCRSGEARNLEASDVNFHRWTITFKNTKNGLDHTLPLTETLKTIILERISCGDGQKLFPLFDPKVITKHIEKACGLHVSPHDLRRTFSGVAEIAGVGSTTKKHLLNHLSGRDVTDDYTGSIDIEDLRVALTKIENKIMEFVRLHK